MLKTRFVFLGVLIITFGINPTGYAKEGEVKERLIAGWLEKVVLVTDDKSLIFRAKLDTGANTSSLHAFDIKSFKKNKKDWVSFKTHSLQEGNPSISMELPVKRIVKIKRHFRPAQVRPVVDIPFCMDSRIYTAEFSLVDRSKFNYPVLLGRRLLQKGILVDPGVTFTLRAGKRACGKLMRSQIEKESEQKTITVPSQGEED